MAENRKSIIATAALVFVCSTASFVAGASGLIPQATQFFSRGQAAPRTTANGLDYKRIQILQQQIQKEYVEPITPDKLTEGALRGMVEGLGDKYSVYMTAEEFAKFNERLEESFTGIGVTVETSPKTGLITVVAPIKGSPGERAGLRPGDAILKVDGKDVSEMPLEEAIKLIRGPKGSQVTLSIGREGNPAPFDVKLTRDIIEFETTSHRLIEPGIGYVQVLQFNRHVSDRIKKAISDLRAEGMTRLILDLRQNPGGLLDEAVDVSSIFLPAKQPVMYIITRGEDGKEQKDTLRSKGQAAFDLPLVVLVDGGSASAAEIVSGALKDTKIGVLMGQKTFGKGLVQTSFQLPDGSGAGLKITTAKYLTAGGNAIHGTGIQPDIEVPNPEKVLPGDPNDQQLAEAIRHIKTLKR